MQNTTIPPVNTNPGAVPVVPIDLGLVGWVMAGLIVLLLIVYYHYVYSNKRSGADVRPGIEDLMASEYSPNTMMFLMFVFLLPVMFGITSGILLMVKNPPLGAIVVSLTALGSGTPFFYLRDKTRSKKRNRYRLDGCMWLKSGERIRYAFTNVLFKPEVILTEKEEKTLYKENPEWEEEGLLKKSFVIPTLIDDKYLIYLITRRPMSETFEWVEDYEYDFFGEVEVKSDSPELIEVATLHNIRKDDVDTDYKVNEYVPTFVVPWDAYLGKLSRKSLTSVDVTQDTVLAGLTKQIGAERRTTAGQLNTTRDALLQAQNDDKDFDDLTKSIGVKKAQEFRRAENALTKFDLDATWMTVNLMTLILLLVGLGVGYALGSGG